MKRLIKNLKIKRRAIATLAALHFLGNPSAKMKIVGVTGTNGKTTTATLLYKIASELGYKAGLIGTVENIIVDERRPALRTTPSPIPLNKLLFEMAGKGCKYVFMEVSSHALDQRRVAGINFVGGIFTNLTHDHLDYHKSFENYFLAKKKFFQMLPKDAFALSNADDEYGRKILENIKAKKYTYGFKNKADFNERLETKLIGEFNAYNILAIYGASILLGFDKERVREIIKNLEPVTGRFENVKGKNNITGIVDFAHTPDALEKVLKTIQGINSAKDGPSQKGKIISVFGCGGDRDPLKRRIMGKIGASLSDIAIITSDNPRSEDPEKIIFEMKVDLTMNDLKKVKTIANRGEAIKEAVNLAQKGDTILIAGKGHEQYQEIKGVKYHFNDMEELKKNLL